MPAKSQFSSSTSKNRKRTGLIRVLRKSLQGLGLSAVTFGMLGLGGCTRQQYRCKTDTEAYHLLDEKRAQSCENGASVIRIEVDPRSRMFDPFNPDRPPMPEDDPQANRFMTKVDHKKGYPLWEANGRTNIVENPEWWQYLPLDERGVLVLDLDDAVRIALLHSTGYQQNLETMYLSALDVSIERFRLDSQFFSGTGTSASRTGPVAAGSPFGRTNVSIGSSSTRMQKLYTAGGSLVANFANSLTWQIAGPDSFTAPSLLSFTFLQPLLAGGGRDVVLERLTLAERALLTNVRAFERYRRGFYTQIATGVGPDTSPSRRGGAFGGAGLGGFDALGSVFNNAGGGGFGGGAVQNANGYIGILQDQLNIANTQENIVRLQDIYLQYEDSYRELLLTMPATQTAIPSQQLQVAQAKQNIYQQQANLLQQQSSYQATLDGFKRTLGLPPYLCIEIEGDLLDKFKLISQELRDRRTEMSAYRAAVGAENSNLLELTTSERDEALGESFRSIGADDSVAEALTDLRQELAPVKQILQTVIDTDIVKVRNDISVLKESIPLRRGQLTRLKEIAETEKDLVCSLLPLGQFNTTFLDGIGLEELPQELGLELDEIVEKIQKQEAAFDEMLKRIETTSQSLGDFPNGRERFRFLSEELILGSQDLIASIAENILAVQLVQARARTESVTLPDIDLTPRDAVEIARRNRRDWLIRRAALVDAWRSIELVADNLESVLNFSLTGNVANVGDNPFALHSSTGTLSAGITWDAPITRVQERNNYRQVLIQYQQARRGYYQYEDGIWTAMRSTLRSVRQTQLAFEIQRFAVQNAALQISINEDIRQINETLGQSSGPTAARDTVQGLQDFLGTQNQLIGLFATFESTRRVLDRDLGTMQIDSEGLWIDPGPLTLDTVGGGVSQAIVEYGLEPGQELLPDRIQLGDPVNVVPLNQVPGEYQSAGDKPIESPVVNPVLKPSIAERSQPQGRRTRISPVGFRSPSKQPAGQHEPVSNPAKEVTAKASEEQRFAVASARYGTAQEEVKRKKFPFSLFSGRDESNESDLMQSNWDYYGNDYREFSGQLHRPTQKKP